MSMWDLLASLMDNPVFAGIAGGAGVSALLYQARAVPERLWNWALLQFSVSIEVDNSDELFERVAIYLSRSPAIARARRLRMVELFDEDAQKWSWKVSFGHGWHVLRDSGTWFLLRREIEEKSEGLSLRRPTLGFLACCNLGGFLEHDAQDVRARFGRADVAEQAARVQDRQPVVVVQREGDRTGDAIGPGEIRGANEGINVATVTGGREVDGVVPFGGAGGVVLHQLVAAECQGLVDRSLHALDQWMGGKIGMAQRKLAGDERAVVLHAWFFGDDGEAEQAGA